VPPTRGKGPGIGGSRESGGVRAAAMTAGAQPTLGAAEGGARQDAKPQGVLARVVNRSMSSSEAMVSISTPARHLPMRVRLAARLGDEALFEFCRINRDLRIERTKEGDLVIMSPTGGETGRRNFALTGALCVWAAGDGSGVGFDSSTGFILPNGAERAPDVAWVRKSRWDSLTSEQRRKFVPLCPDFVIELRSPSDELDELKLKMQEYMENGATLGWLIDPDARRVYVYRAGAVVECLEGPDAVSGEPLLPGFVLSLAAIR